MCAYICACVCLMLESRWMFSVLWFRLDGHQGQHCRWSLSWKKGIGEQLLRSVWRRTVHYRLTWRSSGHKQVTLLWWRRHAICARFYNVPISVTGGSCLTSSIQIPMLLLSLSDWVSTTCHRSNGSGARWRSTPIGHRIRPCNSCVNDQTQQKAKYQCLYCSL